MWLFQGWVNICLAAVSAIYSHGTVSLLRVSNCDLKGICSLNGNPTKHLNLIWTTCYDESGIAACLIDHAYFLHVAQNFSYTLPSNAYLYVRASKNAKLRPSGTVSHYKFGNIKSAQSWTFCPSLVCVTMTNKTEGGLQIIHHQRGFFVTFCDK